MSRLQEYLKTPNPFNLEGFTYQRYPQQSTPNIFQENVGQMTEQEVEKNIQKNQKISISIQKQKNSPILSILKQFNDQQPKIEQKLIFDHMSQQSMQTPINKLSKKQCVKTTAQKKYDLRINGNISLQNSQNKQSQRSLRVLTSQAYNVVCKKGPLTYKLVSEEIINDTCDLLSSKEQNNIKRRVYDALNVLIALGKLQKKGRRILLSKNHEQQKQHRQKIHQLSRQLNERESEIRLKKRFYLEQKKKIKNLKKLIQKNIYDGSRNCNTNKISIPFIIIRYQDVKQMDNNIKNYVRFQFNKYFNHSVICDLSCLENISCLTSQ